MNKICTGMSAIFLCVIAFWAGAKTQTEQISNAGAKMTAIYAVKKGARFNICNDFSAYISSMTEQEIRGARSIIKEKKLNFTLPDSVSSTPERYIQLSLAAMGQHPIKISKYQNIVMIGFKW